MHGEAHRWARWWAILIVAWAPVLLDPTAPAEAAALFALAEGGDPYFVPGRAWLLYVRVPLVAISAMCLLASPGLILAYALGRGRSLDRWILYGFGLSLVLLGGASSGLTWLGVSLRGRGFALVPIALSLGALVFAGFVVRRGRSVSPPSDLDRGRLLSYLLPPAILLVCLAPKFLWESFNGDGAHAFEASRMLLERPLPFWDPAAGSISLFPGLTTMLFAFPASWFIRLFGELEVAVRLPFLMHLAALYAAICALARARPTGEDRERGLAIPDRWLVWLGLTVYALAMAFSATYNPYHADIALPGAQDTLFLACFLGFVHAFVRDDLPGMTLFLGLSATALPSWVVLAGLWLLAVPIVWRPVPVGRLVRAGALVVGAFLAIAWMPVLLVRLSLPVPGSEHAVGGLVERLGFIRLTDWRRWLYLLVPGGIFPALYLLAWKRQDGVGRALTLVAGGYFLFFYVQAFTSLHHYLPAAVLPLAVLWRDSSEGRARRRLRAFVLVAGLAALVLSLPTHGRIHTHGKAVGYAVDDRRRGYDDFDSAIFASLDGYWSLFRRVVHPDVPEVRYGGSPLVWNYYAHHRRVRDRTVYAWLPPGSPPPPRDGSVLVESGEHGDLYVVDVREWLVDRSHEEPSSVGRLFAIPKRILFHVVGERGDPQVRDLSRVLRELTGEDE